MQVWAIGQWHLKIRLLNLQRKRYLNLFQRTDTRIEALNFCGWKRLWQLAVRARGSQAESASAVVAAWRACAYSQVRPRFVRAILCVVHPAKAHAG